MLRREIADKENVPAFVVLSDATLVELSAYMPHTMDELSLISGFGEVKTAKYGKDAAFDLVFHGGSGTPAAQLQETLEYGVIKMNIDTDTQYAFTRPVVDFMMKHYDEVLMIDGEIGSKKSYDPRTWLKLAEAGVAKRMMRATYRQHQHEFLQPLDLVLVARPSIADKDFGSVERDLLTTLRQAGLLK